MGKMSMELSVEFEIQCRTLSWKHHLSPGQATPRYPKQNIDYFELQTLEKQQKQEVPLSVTGVCLYKCKKYLSVW